MALITDLPASTTVASTDLFVKDTGSTTQKITAANLFKGVLSNTPDVIYNGGKATTGTITLTSAYTNYKFLLFEYITNTDKCAQLIPSSLIDSGSIMFHATGGSWNSSYNCFQYESQIFVSKVSTTQFSVTSAYRDANWNLGVQRILGFK